MLPRGMEEQKRHAVLQSYKEQAEDAKGEPFLWVTLTKDRTTPEGQVLDSLGAILHEAPHPRLYHLRVDKRGDLQGEAEPFHGVSYSSASSMRGGREGSG